MTEVKPGDFSHLAKHYIHRNDYSSLVIEALISYTKMTPQKKVADVGAGTGKFSKNLAEHKCAVTCVEPNKAMYQEGIAYTKEHNLTWHLGNAENIPLPANSYDWVTMASSFHWTNTEKALSEFFRILKSQGFVTVLWNPRDIASSDLETEVEKIIQRKAPHIKRKSSGICNFTSCLPETLTKSGLFKDLLFIEAPHQLKVSKERYLGMWRSVNDIRSQVTPTTWFEILNCIEDCVKNLNEIVIPYKTRAWTVQKTS
jgi:ubiquinone/menaquinone biosynthesis C-methylase UbiE